VSADGSGSASFLPPRLLDRLGGLEVIAKTVVEGFLPGLHHAPFRGAGLDFTGHRPYQQGDELRRIDWRLFGRTDRHYVREYREDASLKAFIVVDATASMGYADPGGGAAGRDVPSDRGDRRDGDGGITKLRYAQIVAASLAHVMLASGDAVGLASFGGETRLHTLPRSRPGHLHDLLLDLERLRPAGTASAAGALDQAAARLRRRGRLVLISDLLEDDDGDALVRTIGHIRARGDEVILLRVLTPTEAGRRTADARLYFDPERPERAVPSGIAAAGLLARRVDAFYATLRRRVQERGAEYVELWTDEPIEAALRRWIASRAA
jgi:uncharacterized protein (DUF58 family)